MYKLIFVLMVSSSAFAQIQSGSLIKAQDLKSSIFNIGDIKQSILTEPQFQAENGDCWRLMNNQPIAGTDLSTLTGMNTLPNAVTEGAFLRQAKPGRVIGTYEADEIKSHRHPFKHYGSATTAAQGGGVGAVSVGGGGTSNIGHDAFGGDETRPKNIAVNFFIKVNRNCSY